MKVAIDIGGYATALAEDRWAHRATTSPRLWWPPRSTANG